MFPTADRYWTSASNTYKYTLRPSYTTSTTSNSATSWVPYITSNYYSPDISPEYMAIWNHYSKKKEKDEFEICKD